MKYRIEEISHYELKLEEVQQHEHYEYFLEDILGGKTIEEYGFDEAMHEVALLIVCDGEGVNPIGTEIGLA